jgi:hypothetical protein
MTIRVQEVNPYSSQTWKDQFKHTDLYQKIIDDYDHVIYSFREATILKAALHHTVYETDRHCCELYKILDAVPYYYFHHTIIDNPEIIVDIGCGTNPFKKTWPNIIGIDSQSFPGPVDSDAIITHFDKEFAADHRGMCDALISINCIHFDRIQTVKDHLLEIAQLVRSGGRAFVSFNIETWLMYTPNDQIQELFGAWPKFDDIINYIYDQVVSTNLNFIINDWPILRMSEDATIRDPHNGNVRLVFTC